jgi:hypothetical protein
MPCTRNKKQLGTWESMMLSILYTLGMTACLTVNVRHSARLPGPYGTPAAAGGSVCDDAR